MFQNIFADDQITHLVGGIKINKKCLKVFIQKAEPEKNNNFFLLLKQSL